MLAGKARGQLLPSSRVVVLKVPMHDTVQGWVQEVEVALTGGGTGQVRQEEKSRAASGQRVVTVGPAGVLPACLPPSRCG